MISVKKYTARECSSNARERVAVSFTIIYYINAHLPHAREFSAYARECITRKLSVASGPGGEGTIILGTLSVEYEKSSDLASVYVNPEPSFQVSPLKVLTCFGIRPGVAFLQARTHGGP